jgi:ADP-heptose:LPS heptosyltransferase
VAAMIADCQLFIGNDSGLAHIAAAVGTPVVLIWGAANLAMARPGAPAERCIVLYRDLACRAACPEMYCVNPNHLECLRSVEASEVVDAATRLLRLSPGNDFRVKSRGEAQ